MFSTVIGASIVGAIIGSLGRVVIRGKQHISLMIVIVAALISTFVVNILGVVSTGGIAWVTLIIQVGFAAIGVTMYTGGVGSRRRSRCR